MGGHLFAELLGWLLGVALDGFAFGARTIWRPTRSGRLSDSGMSRRDAGEGCTKSSETITSG